MLKLDGCDDRALVLDDDYLSALRWGAEQEGSRVPLIELTPGKVVRDDKGKLLGLFGTPEERVRVDFDRLILSCWVPLAEQGKAETFVEAVNAAADKARAAQPS